MGLIDVEVFGDMHAMGQGHSRRPKAYQSRSRVWRILFLLPRPSALSSLPFPWLSSGAQLLLLQLRC